MLLAYREDSSFFAVGRALDVHHQTVQRCVERGGCLAELVAWVGGLKPLGLRKSRDPETELSP